MNTKFYLNIEIDVNTRDYPDFCDSFITYAEHLDGTPLNDDELDELNDDGDFVYELCLRKLHF